MAFNKEGEGFKWDNEGREIYKEDQFGYIVKTKYTKNGYEELSINPEHEWEKFTSNTKTGKRFYRNSKGVWFKRYWKNGRQVYYEDSSGNTTGNKEDIKK